MVALVRLGAPADSAQAQAKLARRRDGVPGPRRWRASTRYERGGDRALVSEDGRSSYVVATFRSDAAAARSSACRTALERIPGVTVGGGELAGEQVGEQVSEDIARAELLAFPILFLLSFFVFRSLVAALLPLAVGGATIMLSFLGMRFVNGAIEPMSIFALNLITGPRARPRDRLLAVHGLALPRGARARARDRRRRCAATMATAGRTVLFSSITVAAALAVAARVPAALPLLDGRRRA